jgi:hypothetical protein
MWGRCWPRASAATAAAVMALVAPACGIQGDDAAAASFAAPEDGARVAGAVALQMTADGITIEKAGEVREDAGHFHVIADDGCGEKGAAVPKDADHVHFGGGQAEGAIYLAPGTHELCLQVGDGAHVALGITDTVEVTVGIGDRDDWCAVIREVDDMFLALDTGGDDFATRQVGYENLRRLMLQLEDGLDQVDAAERENVHTTLAFGVDLASAYAQATDEAAAHAAIEELFAGATDDAMPGAGWIEASCGVDIDG